MEKIEIIPKEEVRKANEDRCSPYLVEELQEVPEREVYLDLIEEKKRYGKGCDFSHTLDEIACGIEKIAYDSAKSLGYQLMKMKGRDRVIIESSGNAPKTSD